MILKKCALLTLACVLPNLNFAAFTCTLVEPLAFKNQPTSIVFEFEVNHNQENYNKELWAELTKKFEHLITLSKQEIKSTEEQWWIERLGLLATEMQAIFLATKDDQSITTHFYIGTTKNKKALKKGLYLQLVFAPAAASAESAQAQWAKITELLSTYISTHTKDSNQIELFTTLGSTLQESFKLLSGTLDESIENFEGPITL